MCGLTHAVTDNKTIVSALFVGFISDLKSKNWLFGKKKSTYMHTDIA